MKQWTINHPDDLHQAKNELDRLPYYYRIMVVKHKPEKGTDEYERWLRQNSFFHRAVVPTYSKLSGLGEDEAKTDLQRRFALYREFPDYYEVESIGDMSNKRLAEFVEACVQFLAMEYGEIIDEMLVLNVNKIKKVKK